ncbi:hypothetical protein D3OALGB2SA_2507 [Olavius algarvensis associated proteobacterium Delta 3]|nr:hypothetical protein D3OALGB2SA_2507 [Olavius algarvensis associated proteobacterium Delta 3]
MFLFTLEKPESIADEIQGGTDELSDDLQEMVAGGLDTLVIGNPFYNKEEILSGKDWIGA